MRDFLFSAGYYFSQVYPCKLLSLEISLQDFFSEITHNLLKLSAAKIHQTWAQ